MQWRRLGWAGLAAIVAAGAIAAPAAASPQGPVIRRTEHGIPHILAQSYRGLGEGIGFAYAQDNICLLADDIRTVSGQKSRWLGDDPANVDSDFYHTALNRSGLLERAVQSVSPAARDLARGYADGVDRYLARTGVAGIPDPACRGAGWVRPISELDVWRQVYSTVDLSGGEAFLRLIAEAQPGAGPATALPSLQETGSNGWALGAAATAGGTGMLLANPHLPWHGDLRFYEMQLTIPGRLNVSGAALSGLPMVNIGHTDRVAWTHTTSTAATDTVTRLTLAPGQPTSYLLDGRTKTMTTDQETITVRSADGVLTPMTRTFYRTQEGPMLYWSGPYAYVLRDANAGNLRSIDEWLAMARATDVRGIHAAQVRYQSLPWVNTMATDVEGNAYYADIQTVPNVPDALADRCQVDTIDDLPVLDGSHSTCAWRGLLPVGQLPTLNRRDYVSNSNDSPWLANPAAPLTGYARIIGDVGTERSPRTRLGLDMIARRLDGTDGLGPAGFTLPTLTATMLADRNLTAEQSRASVAGLCAQLQLGVACAALAGWNGRADLDARGAILWEVFTERLSGTNPWLVPYDPADPAHTPSGFDVTEPAVRQALIDAVHDFDEAGVPPDERLGDVQHYEGVPIHGCAGEEGCFNVTTVGVEPLVPAAQTPDVVHGSSFIMAVELTRAGPRARLMLTYSQSSDPTSPYFTDQTKLYSAKQWVDERWTEQQIVHDPALTTTRLPAS
jgi:acyl-homoserine-lactone acylase